MTQRAFDKIREGLEEAVRTVSVGSCRNCLGNGWVVVSSGSDERKEVCGQCGGASNVPPRECPTCATLRAQISDNAMQSVADFGQYQEACETIIALRSDIEKLSDPEAVYVNMVRGTIAKPSLGSIENLYPEFKHLRTALLAVTRASNILEAAQIAEAALRAGTVPAAAVLSPAAQGAVFDD